MVTFTKINVIDLDKTLISYDSFRILIISELKKLNLYIFFLTLMRILRFLTLGMYKKKVTLFFLKTKKSQAFKSFAEQIYQDIDPTVLKIINKETDENTMNVLLSASPDFFVKYIIDKLNWAGSGSYIDNENNFVHLHGKNKINWIKEKYNISKYEYNFAISDSDSDKELLSHFRKHKMWTS